MIKRDITETIYEYDKEGKLVKKTVTETHEEEEEKNTISTYQTYPNLTAPYFGPISTTPYCGEYHNVTLTNTATKVE